VSFFRQHHLHRAHKYYRSHREVLWALTGNSFEIIIGALVFALMPVILTNYLHSERDAGFAMALFSALQILLLFPLAGRLIDRKGAIWTFQLGVFLEFLGAMICLLRFDFLGILIFFAGYYCRWAFFVVEAFLLEKSKPSEGGFVFGIREELFAIANFLGILAFPIFLAPESWYLLPLLSIATNFLTMFFLQEIKNKVFLPWRYLLSRRSLRDARQHLTHRRQRFFDSIHRTFNISATVRAGWRFITINHRFPLFVIGTSIFEGIFYGAIWFLFPIHLAHLAGAGGESLSLGIYEIVTLVLALLCGLLADRINWRFLEESAWFIMLITIWLLPFWHSPFALVLLGFFIGLANNFFTAASNHALAFFNNDHEEDGRFTAFNKIIMNMGFMISPIICGLLYQYWGFQIALFYIAIAVTIIALWMIYLSLTLKKPIREKVQHLPLAKK
jgi:MFS family permease